MRRWIRWGGIVVGTLFVVAAGALLVGARMGSDKMQRRVSVVVMPIALPTDAARIDHGRYLFTTRGCAACHGARATGGDVINDGAMLVVAPNLTAGRGSAVGSYGIIDWVRTIRHGVKPDGRPVIIMPSQDYSRLSDDDLGAVIAYIQQLPAGEGPGAVIDIPLQVRVLYGIGLVQDAAEVIDHSLPPAQPVTATLSASYGAYVATACLGCHGQRLSGGKIPGSPPEWPDASNLTPGKGSVMPRYPSAAVFSAMLRSGHRPGGSAISSVMPFKAFGAMDDTDIGAVYLYLKTLPARDAGQR